MAKTYLKQADIHETDNILSSIKGRSLLTMICMLVILVFDAGSITIVNQMVPALTEAVGVDRVTFSNILFMNTVFMFVMGITVGPWITGRFGPRVLCIVGACSCAIYMFGYALSVNYWVLMVAACIGGVSSFGTFTPVAAIAGKIWPKNHTKIYGLILGIEFFVVSSYTFMLSRIFAMSGDYKLTFVVAGICCCVALLLALFGIGRWDTVESPEALAAAREEKAAATEAEALKQGFVFKQALKTPALWLLVLGNFAGAIILAGVSSYGSTIFVKFGGMEAADAAAIMSLYTVFGGIHFLYSGFLQKHAGMKGFLFYMYIAIMVGCGLLMYWVSNQNIIFAVLGLFGIAMCRPLNSLPPMMVPELFGFKDYSRIVVFVRACFYGGVALSQKTTAMVISYLPGETCMVYFIVLAVISLVMLLVSLAFNPMKKLQAQFGENLDTPKAE